MTENLGEMLGELNNVTPMVVAVEEEDEGMVPVEEASSDENTSTVVENEIKIDFIKFSAWVTKFEPVITEVSGIKKLNMSNVRGIDPTESIIFKLPVEDDKMITKQIDDTNEIPVLDLPPISFTIYKNNTFMITHLVNEQVVVKCYGLKTGPLLFFCRVTEHGFIPFQKEKIKKKNDGSINISSNYPVIDLDADADAEGIFLLYKQAQKVHDKMKTKKEALIWFTEKMKDVSDINHLIKIDQVLLNSFK